MAIDAAAAAFVASGTIGLGRGVTCAGRNLAVRKQALLDIGGYAALPDSLSGDDDFVLQKISAHPKWNVRYAFGADTVVPAVGPNSMGGFIKQKQRHISAGRYFSFFAQSAFALFFAANFVLWIGFIVAPFYNLLWMLPFLAKLLLDYFVLFTFSSRFDKRFAAPAFLIWEPLYLYYNVIVGPLAFFKKIKWKA